MIEKELKEEGIYLNKYYAIIIADGDNMGKWIGGEFLENQDDLMQFHQMLTGILGDYAKDVREIICKPKGVTVYSGGDDIFAFANRHSLFEILREIREKFPHFHDQGFDTCGHKSTLSAGVCIAHYKTPLPEAIKWARKMESLAKDVKEESGSESKEKDAVAIAVMKRSGNITTSVHKWQYNGEYTLKILDQIITMIRTKEFSFNFIRALMQEFEDILDEQSDINGEEFGELFKTECRRLIARSCKLVKEPEENDEAFKKRKQGKIQEMTNHVEHLISVSKNYGVFTSLLDLCMFMSKEEK